MDLREKGNWESGNHREPRPSPLSTLGSHWQDHGEAGCDNDSWRYTSRCVWRAARDELPRSRRSVALDAWPRKTRPPRPSDSRDDGSDDSPLAAGVPGYWQQTGPGVTGCPQVVPQPNQSQPPPPMGPPGQQHPTALSKLAARTRQKRMRFIATDSFRKAARPCRAHASREARAAPHEISGPIVPSPV